MTPVYIDLMFYFHFFPIFRFSFITAFSSVFAELFVRFGCLAAVINLHKAILVGTMHAPVTFFDQTPSGRILSRFSKDIDVLDVVLPETIKWFLYCAAEVIAHLFSPSSQLWNTIDYF